MSSLRGAFVICGISTALLGGLLVGGAHASGSRIGGRITIATVNSDEEQANGGTFDLQRVSANGRFIVYRSSATNLAPPGGELDIYIRDQASGTTQLVSVGLGGHAANSNSDADYGISSSGRYVVFSSFASNLVRKDNNDQDDVFVRDQVTKTTRKVSVSRLGPGGGSGGSISDNGRYVAFTAEDSSRLVRGDDNGFTDIFVRDLRAKVTRRVSVSTSGRQANEGSYNPALSGDGRFVVFYSLSSNLVKGDTNAWSDVFVHDNSTGHTTRVSVGSSGKQGNFPSYGGRISSDGRYVTFASVADNLVAGDTNERQDVFVRDRRSRTTTRVSIGNGGQQGDGDSGDGGVSGDGRYVAFWSRASNLVHGDTNELVDVFIRDRRNGTTARISVGPHGEQSNGDINSGATISADGRHVTWDSSATNLVSGDANELFDIFVWGQSRGSQ